MSARSFFAALLALASFGSAAQIVWPPEPAPFVRPACDPAPYGTGTRATQVTSVPGYEGSYWYCAGSYATHGALTVRRLDYIWRWPDGWQAMSVDELIDAWWRTNVSFDCNALAEGSEFTAICNATRDAMQADTARPAHPTWAVAGSGLLTTRATYVVAMGADGTTLAWTQLAAPRAAVGEACACNLFTAKVGTQTRCPLASGATAEHMISLDVEGTPTPTTKTLRVWAQCTRKP